MKVSIYDVANATGLSIATVSRALNDPDHVRPKNLAKVQQAILELGYAPNAMAQNLARQRSTLVGVMFEPNAQDSTYGMECLAGFSSVLEANGYHALLLSNRGEESLRECLDLMQRNLIVGVASLTGYHLDLLHKTFEEDPGCCFGYIGKPRGKNVCNVYAGYEQYVTEILRSLKQEGHTKVLALFSTEDNTRRFRCAQDSIGDGMTEDHAVLAMSIPVNGPLDRAVEQAIVNAFRGDIVPAVFADSVKEAAGLLDVCRRNDIHIPKDFAMVTVSHCPGESNLLSAGIRSYLVPARRMGESLARMLLRRIRGEIQPEQQVILGHYE